MADSFERGAGKPASAGPSTSSGARRKERRVPGGKVVESRYLDYEKKTTRKAPATDSLKTGGNTPGGGKRPSQLQKSKDRSGGGKGDLQSTLLEGHGSAPPDLDLSAINEKSTVRKTPQLEKTTSEKTESTSFSAPRKKSPSLSEEMEMMESQTLLLTLLAVKMENGLARFEEEAEKHLLKLCEEKEDLQKKTHELKRRLLLCRKKRELEEALDAQIEMLSPFEAVAERFKEQYKTFATALDALQSELKTTQKLLEDLGIGNSEENVQVLDLLGELKDMAVEKDLELR
uniref:HAUS augmin like complex subunit 8 n=1 Tax=Propithecus coquereli TaxID=379532 RepID=A0A2K6G0J5_PROCO